MSWTSERARIASLTRSRQPDDPELLQARSNLVAARAALAEEKRVERDRLAADTLAAWVERVVATAPPLSAEQKALFAAILNAPGAA